MTVEKERSFDEEEEHKASSGRHLDNESGFWRFPLNRFDAIKPG